MATQFSMLSIMNAALLEQGCQEITENDGSDEFRVLAQNWPFIVEAELEDGNYYFTREQSELVTRAPGKYGYDDAYVVPSGALHVRNLWTLGDDGKRYEAEWSQDGTYVFVNSPDGCFIEWISVANQDLWSANFSKGVKKRLEAVISRALKEEFGEAAGLDQAAEVFFQRARTNSSKARIARPMYRKGPIGRARNRRG